MKGFGDLYKDKKKRDKKTQPSKEQIIKQAFKFHLQGNIQKAAKYYQYLINEGINDHRVLSNYGIILSNIGKLQEAELYTRKAIEMNPKLAEAHSNLGNILKDLGNLKESELSYRKAIKIKPDYAEAHYNLGIIFNDLGKLEEAEVSTRKAIKIKPDYAEAHYNLGNTLKDLGNLKESELSYRKAIELNPNLAEAYSNLGTILKDLGNLKESELSYRKAIELNPNLAEAYSNLGNVLIDLGYLKEAEISLRKAIELNPNLVKAYYALSRIQYSDGNKMWQNLIFTEKILIKKSKKEEVYIYFTRANILHKEKKFKESSKYLKLANKLNLIIKPYKPNYLIDKSKALLIKSEKKDINKKADKKYCENIFIVGMPRSGSTLLESILSMNNDIYDLGEINFLEESFQEYENSKEVMNIAELYMKKVNKKTNFKITIDKNLYNYLFTGIISTQIPNAKIIHCFRNPLDNILSIYRANFAHGNEYSSSLVDCARIYLDQENVMKKYKNRFPSKIYDLNYDSLVTNPNQEIKSLIKWLGWEWNDSYLSPHLNKRSVSTASNVQIRSPINSKSIGGWKNYKEMLKPAIEILTKTNRYQNLI